AELAEDGIQNLFDADRADDFAHRPESVIEVQGDIFRGFCVLQRLARAGACFQGAPPTIAMAEVDRLRILGPQISIADAKKNFAFERIQTVAGPARDPKSSAIFPVPM